MDFVSNVHSSSYNSSRLYRLTLKTLKSQNIYIYELHAHRINTFYIINKKKSKRSMIQKYSMSYGMKS